MMVLFCLFVCSRSVRATFPFMRIYTIHMYKICSRLLVFNILPCIFIKDYKHIIGIVNTGYGFAAGRHGWRSPYLCKRPSAAGARTAGFTAMAPSLPLRQHFTVSFLEASLEHCVFLFSQRALLETLIPGPGDLPHVQTWVFIGATIPNRARPRGADCGTASSSLSIS